jgi:hypothetical protein
VLCEQLFTLYPFIPQMPVMHRIACLRDDVIFIIFIFQRFSYPVDKTRRNEVRERVGCAPPPPTSGYEMRCLPYRND